MTNLLDLSEFDTLCNSSNRPILGLTPNLANEDSLNSNLNPAAVPFTPMANPFVPATTNINTNPFQDAFTNNKPQDNQVPGSFLQDNLQLLISIVNFEIKLIKCIFCFRSTIIEGEKFRVVWK